MGGGLESNAMHYCNGMVYDSYTYGLKMSQRGVFNRCVNVYGVLPLALHSVHYTQV